MDKELSFMKNKCIVFFMGFIGMFMSCNSQNSNVDNFFNVVVLDTDTISKYYYYIKVRNEQNNDTLNIFIENNNSMPVKLDTLKLGGSYRMIIKKLSKLRVDDDKFIRLFNNKFYVDDKLLFEHKNNSYLLLSVK